MGSEKRIRRGPECTYGGLVLFQVARKVQTDSPGYHRGNARGYFESPAQAARKPSCSLADRAGSSLPPPAVT